MLIPHLASCLTGDWSHARHDGCRWMRPEQQWCKNHHSQLACKDIWQSVKVDYGVLKGLCLIIDWYFSILELVSCVLVCCRQSLKQLKMPCVFPAPLFNKHEALASCLSLLGFFPHVCKVAIILVICLIWLRRLMRQRMHVLCKLLGTPPNCTNQ